MLQQSLTRFLLLIRMEAYLEFRLKTGIYSILLYGVAAVFVAALSLRKQLPAEEWIALFWIVNLFVGVHAVSKSFIGLSEGQQLYLYNLAEGNMILLAKIIYNAFLLTGLVLLLSVLFASFLGNPFPDPLAFLPVALVGGAGLASSLTLVSAMAAAARQRTSLMAVLSFPLLFPFLLALIRLSQSVVEGMSAGRDWRFVLGLIGVQVVLSWLLFPFLWRD